MSFKQFIPEIQEEWDAYWKKTSVEDELGLIKTDGLRPIFAKLLTKKGKILEAGCGLGKWIITLSRQGYNIQGVDTNQYALKKLKKHFPDAKAKIADVQDLPFPDETFDAYLSLGVVEHFEEGPEKALREAYRVLKKGGVAFIEVPFDSPLRKLARAWTRTVPVIKTPARVLLELLGVRKKKEKIKMRFYEYRYTRQELESFVKKAGFKKIKIYPKDDLSDQRSIALWLDYQKLQKSEGKMFELNKRGSLVKRMLEAISPLTYCALIVAVARKS
ncbi:methyltransferase domain-containing protein [Patescibacteria group bacterium]|nr:methyltransferase domain-containing protein [Patescibacteria group bacterium]